MHISSRGYVSIVEIIFYVPSIIASIIICSRHGFSRSSGWLYTLILCVVRIVGAVCQLLTYSNDSSDLLEATIIIDSIGLSPLLFATLGMLSRLIDWINIASPGRFGIKQFRLVQLLISLGLILSIVGGTSSTPDPNTGKVSIPTTSRVGIILYIVAFLAIGLITLISAPSLAVVPVPERKILAAIVLSFPFIFTRLLYSALSVFVGGHHFSVVDGSVAVLVAMAAVEEFIVVFIYLVLGFKLEHLTTDQQGPIASRPWKGRKNGPENRRHRSHGGSRSRERATTAPIGLERYQREQV